MTISVKIQRPAGSDKPLVSAVKSFVLAFDRTGNKEHGKLALTVNDEAREFALKAGGDRATEHPLFVDQPTSETVYDWGTAADEGGQVVVKVVSADHTESKDSAPIT